MPDREPSITGYLTLGLLAGRDWSAYQLAEQLGRGVAELWPSADRGRYAVLTRLRDEGLVDTRQEHTGKRARTIYSITPEGREALTRWLSTPVRPPSLEFEGMVRVLLSDQGSLDDLRRTLAQTREQARANRDMFARYAAFISETGGTFPERRHLFALANTFMIGHYDHVIAWADWAAQQLDTWPDTVTPATTHQAQVREMLAPGREAWQANGDPSL
ncbi:helix-turn-helix transcriptional regulator [Microbacterium sp. M3]|uniref:Helix-turn-helix transcriptional regulator n=1 Tax=Microbacterium arthrosphaerae TaxID=792652 RepID=A0ABU4H649_9MICO|nr:MULTISPECIES: helix-turn-helix transcriptional regulator [Microbacterium]MDW4574145.1 helix-turn-helix transcriptional regulator [Microbacterium arthrosphaerae]MDW7608000.1 helix-turn-helix transcriptional regulator [Microbacterium sp. M3]